MNSNNFSLLPKEILGQIFSYLDHKDLMQATQVCQKWFQAANDPSTWKLLCIQESLDKQFSSESWKGVYIGSKNLRKGVPTTKLFLENSFEIYHKFSLSSIKEKRSFAANRIFDKYLLMHGILDHPAFALVDLQTGKILQVFNPTCNTDKVKASQCFQVKYPYITSGGYLNQITLWEVGTKKSVSYKLEQNCQKVDFNNNVIIGGCFEKQEHSITYIFNRASQQLISKIESHAFSLSESYLDLAKVNSVVPADQFKINWERCSLDSLEKELMGEITISSSLNYEDYEIDFRNNLLYLTKKLTTGYEIRFFQIDFERKFEQNKILIEFPEDQFSLGFDAKKHFRIESQSFTTLFLLQDTLNDSYKLQKNIYDLKSANLVNTYEISLKEKNELQEILWPTEFDSNQLYFSISRSFKKNLNEQTSYLNRCVVYCFDPYAISKKSDDSATHNRKMDRLPKPIRWIYNKFGYS
ncbi:MAG: F-box family [Chlamydiales bacterium]|jgi:hypothetical protein|nr:F-box family [Chlamydiales bacterium]